MKNFKSWPPNEDQALLKVYRDRSIHKWAKISSILQTEYGIQKSAKKCRQRFKNHLNPSIKKDEWSEDQERTLLNLHEDIGNRWAQISRRLPGRTDNAVKNKFYSLFRKAVSNINSLLHKQQPSHFKQIQIPFIYKIVSLIDDKHKSNSLLPGEVIKQAEALKSKIFQYKDIEVETYVLGEGQLQGLFNMVQSVNSYFKKKMIRKSRRKISSTKNSSMEALQTNLKFPTEENLITFEKISGPEPSFEIKQMRHNFENPLFHISPTFDKIIMKNQHNMNELCIQQLHNDDSDIWKIPRSEYHDYSEELY